MIGRFEVNYQVTEVPDEHAGDPVFIPVGKLWQASANVLVPSLRLGVVGVSVAGDPQTAIAAATSVALFKIENWPKDGE
jgi:hypothetical protein